MKKEIVVLGALFLGMGAMTSTASAKTEGIALENQTTITDYDVTGDGIKDEIIIKPEKVLDDYFDMGNGWKILVNNEAAYTQKEDREYGISLSVQLYYDDSDKAYLYVVEDNEEAYEVYNEVMCQYYNNQWIQSCDFRKPFLKYTNNWDYHVTDILSISEKIMKVELGNQFCETGWMRWNVVYRLKNGQWKADLKNVYKVKYSFNGKKKGTTNKNLSVYNKLGGKKKTKVKEGTKVKITQIAFRAGRTYLQLKLPKGKTVWLKTAKKYAPTAFKEAIVAG